MSPKEAYAPGLRFAPSVLPNDESSLDRAFQRLSAAESFYLRVSPDGNNI
jgi:hypothetical protein